ncbi:MAG: hypothetical protein KF886_22715 [Candidatus Hydrogenedentes bacterium]|nr:hypothetical protein [Candidatus Hydrogenedentota bacterium]
MAFGPAARHTSRFYLYVALAAFAASAALCWPATAADDFVLRMVGRAEGVGFTARHAALQAARQEVIWEILKSKIASGDLRPYRVMVRNADAYIKRTDELHVDTAGGHTRVEIDAYVDIHALEQDLAATAKPRLATPPAVACLIAEQDEHGMLSIAPDNIAERRLVEGLEKLELKAHGHQDTAVKFKMPDLHEAVTGNLIAAAAYARESLADAVVLGVVTVSREADQDKTGTARTVASLEARVFRGSDGDLLEVFARSAAITGNDADACREEAIGDAVTKIVGNVTVATVLSVLSSQKRDEVLITLSNPGTRDRMALLMGLMSQDPAVHSIEEAYFSERSARIRVGYDGPMSRLVDLIADKLYDGWLLEVQEVIGREMNLLMRPLAEGE